MNNHVKPPAEPQDASIYIPTDVTPEQLFQAIGRLRKEARDEIDRLLGFLDATEDTDTDTQCDDEQIDDCELEPSLCGVEVAAKNMPEDPIGDDCELDDSDYEPSLGSGAVGVHNSQARWAMHGTDDLEDEHDGAEPSEDNEPSIGYDHEPAELDDADKEPCLGWTTDGVVQNTSYAGCDAELQNYLPVAPQGRTETDRKPLTVEVSYRRFLRGLPPNQRAAMQDRLPDDSGVSLVGGPAWGEKS
jgi:hypothetical protein